VTAQIADFRNKERLPVTNFVFFNSF